MHTAFGCEATRPGVMAIAKQGIVMIMREKLKIAMGRRLAPLLIRWYWRGAKATDLSVRNEMMVVSGGAIGVRIYRPRGAGPFPVLQFFHGGGWVFGDLETHDALCRDLCVQGGHLVVAVDYRLAPEHPFPTAVEDCLASLAWIKENAVRLGGNAESIVLCGDSSGGNLAAVAAQQARGLFPGMIKGQALIYPVTAHCADARWDFHRTQDNKQFRSMTELWDLYLRNSPLWRAGMTAHELATPLHYSDLGGLPRTLVVIAEEDLLREEAAEYARRLEEVGVSAQVLRYAGQQHGFVGLRPSVAYKQAVADIVTWLNEKTILPSSRVPFK
jgi:acetyl esterase